LELKEIRVIIDLMKKNDLALFQLEREGFKIKLQRGAMVVGAQSGGVVGLPAPAGHLVSGGLPAGQLQAGAAEGYAPPASSGAAAEAAAGAAAATAGAAGTEHREIRSPMVGTFYQAASPESPPFVKVGQEVDEETVVCIIEAMKVMNEIKAETRGVIAEIVAENGKPVQFGQALFKVK
jgi:acetyl-CoA carboxylase biotin carboxyl carrier protein